MDAIRIICAAVVALGHFRMEFAQNLAPVIGPQGARLVEVALGNSFNGPAAVIVFFVLSGFVIHLPYSTGRPFHWAEFAARRYTRIIPPVLVFMIVAFAVGRPLSDWDWNNTVLWSVICELIYYTMYPALRRLPVSFLTQCLISFALPIGIAVLGWSTIAAHGADYNAFGYATFLLGLPAWLAGCAIADHRLRFPALSPAAMWSMRIGIILLSIAFRVVKFHGEPYVGVGASNVWLLTAFAVPAAIWLGFEARYYEDRSNPILRRLERAGMASYSLYLVHPLILSGLAGIIALGDMSSFLLYIVAAAIGTVAFYFAVERPSHHLARRFGGRLRAHRESRSAVPTR
nr:acyltransferase [Microbacterium sp. CFBP 13617]